MVTKTDYGLIGIIMDRKEVKKTTKMVVEFYCRLCGERMDKKTMKKTTYIIHTTDYGLSGIKMEKMGMEMGCGLSGI